MERWCFTKGFPQPADGAAGIPSGALSRIVDPEFLSVQGTSQRLNGGRKVITASTASKMARKGRDAV